MNSVARHWEQSARKVVLRIHCARFLHTAVPLLVGGGAMLVVVGFITRWWQPELAGVIFGISGGFIFAFACAAGWVRVRRRRIALRDGLGRLDAVLGLDNALTSAHVSRGKWPAPASMADPRLKLDWMWIAPRVSAALLLASVGFYFSTLRRDLADSEFPPPRSHEEIAAMISRLEETGVVPKEDLDRMQKELESIREGPAEDWYRHNNLEAADHLLEGMKDRLNALSQNLEAAASSLAQLNSAAESMGSGDRERLAQEFKSAIQKMKLSSPGLNETLMSALSNVDPFNLRSLNQAELQRMLDGMKTAAGACKRCVGSAEGVSEAENELRNLPREGKEGKPGLAEDGKSKGAIQRGPGVAPLPLSESPTDLATRNPESLRAADLRQAQQGDVIGSTDTEHQLDQTRTGPQSAGSAASGGTGGDPVWRDALMPHEKAILQKYFK